MKRLSNKHFNTFQLGTAIGFLIPPLLVKNNMNRGAVEQGMYTMLMGTAVLNTVVLILIHMCK